MGKSLKHGEQRVVRAAKNETTGSKEKTMTTIIDISGVNNVCQNMLTHDLHGGERVSALQTNYPDQDRDSYVPDASNIAPRRKGWKPKKSNTQMPPIKGKGSDEQPQVQVTRGPKYYGKLNKLL